MIDDLLLNNFNLQNIKLRSYQIEGIQWFIKCIKNGHGGILADEMGLGKTIQTICALVSFEKIYGFRKFLIIAPLSTIDNWKSEFSKFSTFNINLSVYIGNKINRLGIRESGEWESSPLILLTTYELFLRDFDEIGHLGFDATFADESHRFKNDACVLFSRFTEASIKYRFLLTGTPLQNNLDELYNLLSLVDSSDAKILTSRHSFKNALLESLSTVNNDSDFCGLLKSDPILSQLILRRIKAEVLRDLPDKIEVLIFHGITKSQKHLYKSILTKDINLFRRVIEPSPPQSDSQSSSTDNRLSNILMQIRKCVLHPYLFPGFEKEPFELGDHIVEQSMKLQILDRLLRYLIPLGHKILVFCQMTKMLDIIQDYCFLRGFNYERLDGSVRCEERFAAIDNFTSDESTKLFLLSTRAGGQGLNLTAADTVILVDSDFNPQIDLQAMARIHRPGQQRPCRAIRLVAKHTVEEMIVFRAQMKLQLSRNILGHEDKGIEKNKLNIKEMICYGLNQLFTEDSGDSDPAFTDEFFTKVLGNTDDKGHWKPIEHDDRSNNTGNLDYINHMYLFEGLNYKPQTSKRDIKTINEMLQLNENHNMETDDKKLKNNNDPDSNNQKNQKQKSENNQVKINKRRQQMWKDNNYKSHKIENDEEEKSSETERSSDDSERTIEFVIGDVTNPVGESNKLKIICHLVDNSGSWGSGGLFSAIDRIKANMSFEYLRASEMEDLKLGDVHVLPVKENIEVALLVAQSRDNNDRISPIRMNHLEKCFIKTRRYALSKNASIHLTRLGYKTPQFNWYGVERLINKHFVEKNIQTFIYYFRSGSRGNYSGIKVTNKLSETYFKSIFKNVIIYFDPSIDHETKRICKKYVYAFDGDVSHDPFDASVTHCIIRDARVKFEKHYNPATHFLPLSWLFECIQKSNLIPEVDFQCSD